MYEGSAAGAPFFFRRVWPGKEPSRGVATALITGIGGQDGSYLAEFLLAKGYRVVGTTRDASNVMRQPYARAIENVELFEGQYFLPSLNDLMDLVQPDEVYNLAGPSRVAGSWDNEAMTMMGVLSPALSVLEIVLDRLPATRCFFAGTSEMFAAEDHAQDESAPRDPKSPYAKAKQMLAETVRQKREEYGVYAVTGILFNHESPRRGDTFASKKIVRGAVRIARGEEQQLVLGSLEVRRDWGFAGDYVKAMWSMLFQKKPEDLVIGTGVAHSVAEFCEVAFRRVGLDWRDHVVSDPSLFRPADAPLRLANPARAKSRLDWQPEVDFERLVAMMVDYELEA
jgi:GDPmannose 4,6-dehydratase